MIDANDDLVTIAFKLCTALREAKIEAVLCGGSAATFYAPAAYQSSDLDFVISWWCDESGALQVLKDMGYYSKGRTYVNDLTPISVDFPKGPLAVGEEEITEWCTVTRGDLDLNVIRPEDCIKDRLCAFF